MLMIVNHTERVRALGLASLVVAMAVGLVQGLGSSADAAEAGPEITDKLMKCCHKARPAGVTADMVMLHLSSDVIAHPAAPYNVDRVIAIYKSAGVSAHYLIDREGKIYRLVKEENQAYHAGKGKLPWTPDRKDKLNQTSIGIELLAIGTKDEMKGLISKAAYAQLSKEHIGYTDAQYKSLKALLEDIIKRRSDIKMDRRHIIGHEEYAPDRKKDPGSLFDWTKIGLTKDRKK